MIWAVTHFRWTLQEQKLRTYIALIRRMMLDIDDEHDLAFMLKQNDKLDFCKKIEGIINDATI